MRSPKSNVSVRTDPSRRQDDLIPARERNAVHREEQLQHQGKPEDRHRLSEEGQRRNEVVRKRVLAHRREDTGGKSDAERYDERGTHQFECCRKALQNCLQYRLGIAGRIAEVAVQDRSEPHDVAKPDRLVEPEVVFEAHDIGGRDVRVLEVRRERPAWSVIEDHEQDDRDQQQEWDRCQRPPHDIGKHERPLVKNLDRRHLHLSLSCGQLLQAEYLARLVGPGDRPSGLLCDAGDARDELLVTRQTALTIVEVIL